MAANGKRKRSPKRGTNTKKKHSNVIAEEIIILGTLAISILLLISNFGIAGFIGEAISTWLNKIFGWLAFVVPFLLFIGVAFFVPNKENKIAIVKVMAGICLTILFCTFFEMLAGAGGYIGAGVAGLMKPAVGVAGTYVLVVILSMICMVIITGKSVVGSVRASSAKATDKARETAERRKTQSLERREIRAQERRQEQEKRSRKITGVSKDTTLSKKSPDVKEILPPDSTYQEMPLESPSQDHLVINRSVPEPEVQAAETVVPEPEVPSPVTEKKERNKGVAQETANVEQAILEDSQKPIKAYKFPPLSLLTKGKKNGGDSDAHLRETAMKLQQTLHTFGVKVTVTNVSCGPSVTRYELQPEMGVKVSRIVGLSDDIKLNLAAADIRIEAPIPGKAAVGIEVPNQENSAVMLRDLLESEEFKKSASKIAFAAGRDIGGKVVVTDIAKMPHLLVAGATGSGKSVCINTLIMSILYEASPEDVKLIMIDPKVVELSVYNGIPHLMIPVVTDPKKAAGALNWAVAEMTRRYQLFAEYNVRDLKGYNEKIAGAVPIEGHETPRRLPQIVIIVDELADLMMVAPGEVEGAICRLAQLARAAGLHLIIATQRPSVNVITGLIKANMPSRIAFSVSSGVDSRTIIDMNGAEKLLGKGDMLFYPAGYQKPARVQGSFVSDKEVHAVVDYLVKHNGNVTYSEEVEEQVNSTMNVSAAAMMDGTMAEDDRDVHFADAGRFIIEKEKASIGMLQRFFKIGFNRAARVMDQLCDAGVVGGEEGTKPRKILMTMDEFEQYLQENA